MHESWEAQTRILRSNFVTFRVLTALEHEAIAIFTRKNLEDVLTISLHRLTISFSLHNHTQRLNQTFMQKCMSVIINSKETEKQVSKREKKRDALELEI